MAKLRTRKHRSARPIAVPWPPNLQVTYNTWQDAKENRRIAKANQSNAGEGVINQSAPVAGSAANPPHATQDDNHPNGPERQKGSLDEESRARRAFMRKLGACADCRRQKLGCVGYYELDPLHQNYLKARRGEVLEGIPLNPAVQDPLPNPPPQASQYEGELDLAQPHFPGVATGPALEAFEFLYDVSNTLPAVPHVDTAYPVLGAITAQNPYPLSHTVLDAVSPFALGGLPGSGTSAVLTGTTPAPPTSSGTRNVAIGKEWDTGTGWGIWQCQSKQSTSAGQNESDIEPCSQFFESVDELEQHYFATHGRCGVDVGYFSKHEDGTFARVWKFKCCTSCLGESDWPGRCIFCSAPTDKWLYWELNLTSTDRQLDQWGDARRDDYGRGPRAHYDETGGSGSSNYGSHLPGSGSNNRAAWSQTNSGNQGYTYSHTSTGSHSVCSVFRSHFRYAPTPEDQVNKQHHRHKTSTVWTKFTTDGARESSGSWLVRNLRGLKGGRREDHRNGKGHHNIFEEWPIIERQHDLSLVFAGLSILSDDAMKQVSPLTIWPRKLGSLYDAVTLPGVVTVDVSIHPQLEIMNKRTLIPVRADAGFAQMLVAPEKTVVRAMGRYFRRLFEHRRNSRTLHWNGWERGAPKTTYETFGDPRSREWTRTSRIWSPSVHEYLPEPARLLVELE